MTSREQPKCVILIVDDSEELLEVLCIILEQHGYIVIAKNSAAGLSDFVRDNKVDLLLLDVILGEKNGRDVCKELKSDTSTNYFPILIMSVTYHHLEEYKKCKADGFIEKPFDLNLLLKKIKEFLEQVPET